MMRRKKTKAPVSWFIEVLETPERNMNYGANASLMKYSFWRGRKIFIQACQLDRWNEYRDTCIAIWKQNPAKRKQSE